MRDFTYGIVPAMVGTSRCDVSARVQRAEGIPLVLFDFHGAAARGADGAARHPYQQTAKTHRQCLISRFGRWTTSSARLQFLDDACWFNEMKTSPLVPALRSQPVPARWKSEVERVLISDAQIARRIQQLSVEIQQDFSGREMVVVSLLNGTVMFLADLVRHFTLPLRLDFMGVSSYGAGTESGELVFTKELRLDVRGRDVLLVDDILDTGKTLYKVLGKLRALKPRRIKTCVLLDKAARRVEKVKADYVGFEIPDFFVVGYGLDFAERYRNLPFVGVLHPEVYKKVSKSAIKRRKK